MALLLESATKKLGMSALSIFKNYGAEVNIHVALNTSTFFDIWGGMFLKGKDGVWYLNGGVFPIMALAGGNNTQKTGKVVKDSAVILFRFKNSIILYGDSESTLDISRFGNYVDDLYGIKGYFKEHIEDERFVYMPNSAGIDGTELHNRMKEIYNNIVHLRESKDKDEQSLYESLFIDTPFYSEKTGKVIRIISPMMMIFDSVSEIKFDTLAFKQFDEGNIDDGGKKRTRDMEIGNLKRILMEDTCNLGPRVGIRSYWIAQTADKINMDGRPQEKETTFIRQNKKYSAPKAMMKLPHVGVEILKGTVLKDSASGTVLYPRSKEAGLSNDSRLNPDLVEYTTEIFRSKSGGSGIGIPFIGSQSEGILDGLSMYGVLKGHGYYGLEGNNTRHACALLPEQTLMRTTVRSLIEENPKLERALGICYQLWYVNTFWDKHPTEFRITPTELYEKVKEQGHDWDEILDTIDFWHDNDEFIKKPILTLYELLEVAVNKKPLHWKEKLTK